MRPTTIVLLLLMLALQTVSALADQSVIVESEGFSCMGDDKSRSQTRNDALTDAKRKAADQAGAYVVSATSVRDYITESDVVQAYSRATVKVLGEMSGQWEQDQASGQCYRLRIRAEVIPDKAAVQSRLDAAPAAVDDPSAPLSVRVWTDRETYRSGQRMKIFLKGNKPFYARVVYLDARGRLIQLLPNAHRTENYFQGGTVYEIPSGRDAFTLEVTPPYGKERVTVYAGTRPLGGLDAQDAGGVYMVHDTPEAAGMKTRGIMVTSEAGQSGAAEFVESDLDVTTGP